MIGIHGYRAVACQYSSRDRSISQQTDARKRQNISYECRVCAESCGTAHLPEVIADLSAVDEQYRRIAARNESAGYLEYPDRIRFPAPIQCERPCKCSGGREAIDARYQRHPGKVCRDAESGIAGPTSKVDIGCRCISLGLQRHSDGRMDGSSCYSTRRKSGDSSARTNPEIPNYNRWSCIGDR